MTKTKTQLLTVAFIVLAAIGFAWWRSGYIPFQNSKQWQWRGGETVIAKEQDTNQNPDIIQLKNGCYRLYSHGGGQTGLQSIYSYYSCDGTNWQFEGKRIEKAAMPAAMITDGDKVRIYFQRGVQNDTQQALMTVVSNDGINFNTERQLLTTDTGELKGIKTIGHFELIKLDKGYRLYFDEGGLTPKDFEKYKNENWEWPVTRIRSLYSEDGLSWKLEPGIRIDYEQKPLSMMQRAGSCTVIKEENEYHMFFNAGFSPWENTKWWKRLNWSGIYEAVSLDGLNWKIIDSDLFGHGSDPKIIRIGNQLKMFISEGDRVGSNSIESFVRKD